MNSAVSFLNGLNRVILAEKENPSDYYNTLCEVIAEEFQLYTAIIFKVLPSNELEVLGKSSFSRKSFQIGSTTGCVNCELVNERRNCEVNSDSECQIKSTDFILNESCLLIKSANDSYLLKLSQKTPFLPAEKDALAAMCRFLETFLKDNQKVTVPIASKSFPVLINDLSQELRTPVNSIIGFTSLLYDQNLTTVQNEYIKAIKENSNKILATLNDLIDLSKIKSGVLQENEPKPGILKSVEEVVRLISEKFNDPALKIEIESNSNIDENVAADLPKLKHVLVNILTFLCGESASGNITIKIEPKEKNQLRFRINHQNLDYQNDKVGQLLYIINSNERKNQKVNYFSPIVLNLAKEIAGYMGGELSVSSSKDGGLAVTFSIKSSYLSILESSLIALPKDPTLNKVLVIEDDYATSKLLSNYLNKWGYEPTIVNSGKKALNLLDNERFLAIITNVSLPDINGLEMMKKIRENKENRHTPIIVCSVEKDQQKAFLMGAVEYFVKPISYKDLVEVLTSYKLKKDSNILCVDDDINMLNLVKDAIESVGFNPIAENNSLNVMSRITGVPLDLAIVDLDMPGLSGFELIKLIKSENEFANLPIIIYTGKENFEEELSKIQGMFSELLSKKSSKIEDLADTINKMVNRIDTPENLVQSIEAEKKQASDMVQSGEDSATGDTSVAQTVTKEPKILLVEDYKHSQIIVTRLLKKNGFTVVTVVENGAEAVDAVKKIKFDLILMDMQMPVMNGFEATERIREFPEYKDTPIIALTAFAMKGDREKCLDSGATDYIPKPIDSQEFIEKVRSYTSVITI
ncbi:MAG: response regulator [Ignavibacteriaceae bacterium]|nr:response regulator [Ignavibacteriaceae bacterium]